LFAKTTYAVITFHATYARDIHSTLQESSFSTRGVARTTAARMVHSAWPLLFFVGLPCFGSFANFAWHSLTIPWVRFCVRYTEAGMGQRRGAQRGMNEARIHEGMHREKRKKKKKTPPTYTHVTSSHSSRDRNAALAMVLISFVNCIPFLPPTGNKAQFDPSWLICRQPPHL